MSFVFLYISSLAHAQEALVVDRPSVGTASSVVSKGTIQLETGVQIDGNPELDCDSCLYSFASASYSLPTMLRVGIHDRFELRPYSSVVVVGEEFQALQDTGLQGKFSAYAPEDKPFSLSLLASGDLEAGGATVLLDFWGEAWGGWINAGNTTTYEDGSTSILLVEGFGIPLPGNHSIFIENSTTVAEGAISSTIESGFTKTYDNFQWDVYALSSVTEKNSWQIATGFAWRMR